jgi:hypothetical protein
MLAQSFNNHSRFCETFRIQQGQKQTSRCIIEGHTASGCQDQEECRLRNRHRLNNSYPCWNRCLHKIEATSLCWNFLHSLIQTWNWFSHYIHARKDIWDGPCKLLGRLDHPISRCWTYLFTCAQSNRKITLKIHNWRTPRNTVVIPAQMHLHDPKSSVTLCWELWPWVRLKLIIWHNYITKMGDERFQTSLVHPVRA